MPFNPALEAEWAADIERCLIAFREAVAEAKEGRFAAGRRLIERVRVRGGDKMAEVARVELRKHAGVSV
jgi:hypothetical protein